jgi:putative isomerase
VRESAEGLTLRFEATPGSVLLLSAALGTPPQHAEPRARRHADPAGIAAHLAAAAARYESRRAAVEGAFGDVAAAVTNNIHWMVALQPESARRYTPAGRRWIFPAPGGGRDHWTIFEWDAFFNALELAVESPAQARETILAVLATQYPSGNVPNWRSRQAGTPDRSQPPVGAFAVLKVYERSGDRALLAEALPALERWSAWWRAPKGRGRRRDGNGSGLFEWGCDEDALAPWTPPWETAATGHQRAAWESGQDDLPSWQEARFVPESGTYDLESVDLNALLALDDECLSRIAAILGDAERALFLAGRADRLRQLVNERLWCEERGLYLDRCWDGRLSPRVAAGNFFPLLAGIPSRERAERMLKTLLDPGLFWGELALPSISRADPLYAEQQYWRGTIWPPTNYLVGQGLRRCGFDAEAAELAARGARLFLRDFRAHQLCRENFDSRIGAGGGQRHQSWGPLFALLALEELADASLFEGLRLGTLGAAEARARRLVIRGREWDVAVSSRGLLVRCDGWTALRSDAPVVLRHVESDPRRFAAEAHAPTSVRLRPGFAPARATIEGQPATLDGGALVLPPGRHRFELVGE